MSFWNKVCVLASAGLALSMAAYADGKDGTKLRPLPEPLTPTTTQEAHDPCAAKQYHHPCGPGKKTYSHIKTTKQPISTRTEGDTVITTYVTGHAKRYYSNCCAHSCGHKYNHKPCHRAKEQDVKLDLGAFTGGVGAGIDTGFYGGGRYIVINSGSRSQVHRSYSHSFNQSYSFKFGGRGKGGCHKCGGGKKNH